MTARTYLVTWSIHVDAESQREAAETADRLRAEAHAEGRRGVYEVLADGAARTSLRTIDLDLPEA